MQTENILRNFFNDPYDIILDFAWPTNLNFYDSCLFGHYENVSEFISKTKYNTVNQYTWNKGLYGACKGGHIHILKIIIKKIQSGLNPKRSADYWDWALYAACRAGHMDIVRLMFKKRPYKRYSNRKLYEFNWNRGLTSACKGDNIEIVKLMLDNGASWYRWKESHYDKYNKNHIYITKNIDPEYHKRKRKSKNNIKKNRS